ncbi:beta-alanyl-bioamine nonribosomal peptide synthetase ebony [Procambarus clarkii]|uniref:beta-alanyl-bioamine nonribosomal peptide synthetase ebony n=1 Tax=Procambarus clarkii TaxID=6728 RepID=UPI001E678104|nr:uncharacterized protein LOC123754330 [Procambarus clarkii]
MALLVGKVRGLPGDQVSTYDVFYRLATSPDTRDKVALVADSSSITYRQLLCMVHSLHLWLRKNVQEAATRCHLGLQAQGDRSSHEPSPEPLQQTSTHLKTQTIIALCLPRSPQLVALILAIWKQGWAYVPLDPSVPALRTLYVVRDAEPSCVITDAHTSIKIRQLECDTTITPEVAPLNHSPYSLADRILDIGDWDGNFSSMDAEDTSCDSGVRTGDKRVACILYTSGSTGNPKGVLLTMENLMNRLHWQWQELPYTEGEMCLMSKSLTFVDSVTELMGPLLGGVPVVVMREEAINPELVIRYVSQHSVTRLVLVPSLLKLLLLYLNTTKDSITILQRHLRIWVTSGEMLPGWLINDFFAMFPGSKFINLYGSTEVTGDVSCYIIDEVSWRAGVKVPVGRPVSNTALLVVRREGGSLSLAREDQPGEIVVLGKNVCAGYLDGKLHRDQDESFLPVSTVMVQDVGLRAKLEDFVSKVCGNNITSGRTQEAVTRAHNTAPSGASCAGHCDDTQNGEDPHSIPSVSVSSAQNSRPQEGSQSPTTRRFKSSLGKTFQPALAPRPGKSPTPPTVPPRTSTPPTVPRRTPRPPHKTGDGSASPSKTPASLKTISGLSSKTLAEPSSKPATRTRADSPQIVTECQKKATAYRTGDLGRVVGGQLVVEGRSDLQVKVRGVRVHLTEVEDAVHRSGYVARVCVVAAKDRQGEDEEEVLAAFVVLKEEFEDRDRWVTEDLGRCLRGYLPRGLVPRLLVVDALPHLPSGKIDRQALLALYHKRMVQRRTSTDDVLILRKEEPIESRVLRIICGALGVSRSQDVLQKNFFELGGSSITSVGVVVRLRDLGLDVTLDAFLKAATIGEVVSDILKAKTMAEVMNLFCSPSPSNPNTAPSHATSSGRDEEGRDDDEEEEEGPVSDMSIPALHPDLPISTSGAKSKGLRLAQLHTLPVSQGVDKHMVIEMVAESFTTKNPLDVTMRVPRAAHHALLNLLWPRLVHDDLSFVVKDPQRGVLGAVINTDFFNEPQMLVPTSMEEIAALHHPLEEAARHLLRQEAGERGVRWVHNLFLATSICLKPQDNVRLALHLEKELLRMAQTKLYHGVFTVNSNPLNQLLCENYLGYQRRGATRVSSFLHKGRQPFASLPHDLLLVAMTKTI